MNELSTEQRVMEERYVLPYNWFREESSRHWRQKNGIWVIAKELSGALTDKKVLDAGCGDGWYTAKMVDEGAVVYGTDYSGKAIEFAKLIVPEASFVDASLLKLPYEDDFFDVIFSFQVLEHIPPEDLPQAVKELARVLKQDGVCIISVPSTIRPMSKAHYQHFTPNSISKALEPFFTVNEIQGQEGYTTALRMVERILENRWWLLKRLARMFNKGWYLKRWNKASKNCGHNLVLRCIKE